MDLGFIFDFIDQSLKLGLKAKNSFLMNSKLEIS